MAKRGSADVGFLLIDGRNVLGDITDVEDTQEALIEDTTVLGDSYEEQGYVGVRRYTLNQQGFYNDVADGINAALVNPGTVHVLSFAPEGNTIGKLCVSASLVQADYVRQISRGALHKANATYQTSAGHEDGLILHTLKAETADSGNTQGADSVNDVLAPTAKGGVGYLQVNALALGGHTDLTVAIQHSTDDASYADLITFTPVTVAPTAERKATALPTTTVNQYLAHSFIFNGAGGAHSGTYMVGFARGR